VVLSIDSVLTGEFASLDEPTDASRIVLIVVSSADSPDLLDLMGRLDSMILCRN
jgi:hypothetical protein